MNREGTPDPPHQRPGRSKIYTRTKLFSDIALAFLSVAFLVVFVATGLSRDLGNWAGAVSQNRILAFLIFCLAAGIAQGLLLLPLRFYAEFIVEHRFGLSNQSVGRWAWEHVKGLLVSLPLVLGALVALYSAMTTFGELWWLPFGILVALASVLLARLAPVILFPLFYTFRPLPDSDLKQRIVSLCASAGMQARNIFTYNMSKNTRKANAAFAGIFRSKRILLGDTLIQEFSGEEIETVVAHELGHYAHHHRATGISFGILSTFVSLFVASKVYAWSVGAAGFTEPTDPGAFPLLALSLSLIGLVVSPLSNALSRRHERQADRYAVAKTGQRTAFISALRKLGDMNLADPDPHPLVEFLFFSHPSIGRRIRELGGGLQ